MKKFVLAVVGMMTVLGLFAYETWTDPKTGIEWKYEVIGDEVSIGGGDYSNTAVPASRSGVLLVPSEISGKRVTSLGSFAFYCCDKLTSVTIPESVTVIGEYAFLGCSGLTSVTIPSSIARIGGWAFYGCSGLGDGVVVVDGCVLTVNGECPSVIVLQNDVRLIADYVFSGFSNLTSITIPKGATSIGESAFSDCSELTSITIPEGVASIGASAFSDCSGLTSVRIPSSVTSIGRNAFYGCPITMAEVPGHTCGMDFSNVTNLVVSEGTTNIAEWAFGRCRSLVSATIPPSVTSIGAGAFDGCSGLTSVTIPEGVTVIGQDAFWGCSGLTSVTIPSSVTSIGRDAFYGCPITTAEVPGHTCGIDFSNVTNLVVSDGTTNIAERAFAGSRSLVSVTIPSSVTSIGAGAFADCVGLESVVIPSSVTSFGSLILEGCEAVTDLTLPGFIQLDDVGCFPELRCLTVADGTVEICQGFAFNYPLLTRVEIPASVRSICTADGIGTVIECGREGGSDLLARGAFDGCSSIVSVQISEAVSNMSDVFPDSYQRITEVSVVEGVKTLGAGLFSGCYSLESIQLPSTLQSIADNAFGMCFALTEIDVNPDNPNFMFLDGALYGPAIYLDDNGVWQDAKRLVLVASNVTRLEIPDGVGSISGGAFSCCGGIFGDGNGLKELIVPDHRHPMRQCA